MTPSTSPTNALTPHVKTMLSKAGPLALTGLYGSASSLLIAEARLAARGPLVIVTPSPEAADQLLSDLMFFAGGSDAGLFTYPAWDVQPYGGLSPHVDVLFERMSALNTLNLGSAGSVVLAPVEALLKRVVSPESWSRACLTICIDEDVDAIKLAERLSRMGYLATDMVVESASFSIRGGIVDVFAPGHAHPVRIELWGNTVDALREFEPSTQRSVRHLKSLTLLPVREELLLPEQVARAREQLRKASSERDLPSKHRRRLAEDISEGIYFPNIEYFLPYLMEPLSAFLEWLSPAATLGLIEPRAVAESVKGAFDKIVHRHSEMLASEPLLPAVEELFTPDVQLIQDLERRADFSLSEGAVALSHLTTAVGTQPTAGLRQTLLAHRGEGMLTPLVERVRAWADDGIRTYIACHSRLQAQRLADLLKPYGVSVPTAAAPQLNQLLTLGAASASPIPLLGAITRGFVVPKLGLALLSEEDIFGPRQRATTSSQDFLKNAVDSFSQLKVGDFVVHAHHGIGIFRGLTRVPVGDRNNDFVQLEYAGGDKLYLPVHRLHTLQRYVGNKGAEPRLDKMGGQTWTKTTHKVKESVLKIARQLLELHAARAVAKGRGFKVDGLAMEEFEATFPYDETPDQLEAIHAIFRDMASPRPMDRLVCGDVGYGKTEVALRAAWLAVMNGYQVAVLVPTTVLAFQHFRTFEARFKDLPVTVAQMSRFVRAERMKQTSEGLATGGIDIVVGTHRLLSDDLKLKNIGLLIIDEEHRFGVRHKEQLKRLRKNIDVLTMTATPIPRTLHMATAGLRDLSIIATPPRDRTAIRTYVTPFSARKIQDAIQEELRRGGQVFFVHNRVQSIDAMARYLSTLVPEGSFDVAHGQMSEVKIETAMRRFIEGESNVLVTTAIIESGLDIPRANTIIINRADRLGLAQLYQLRGRVGRSDRRAFAYLLTPAGGPPTQKAERRLRAMEVHSELGAGFKIANEDLEMRGAGNLLGQKQSGSIAAVGFETYVELLHKAVQELSGQDVDDDFDPDVDIRCDAFIPDDYIPDFQQRLQVYRRLATARSEVELRTEAEELADRYGALPSPVAELYEVMLVRVEARRLKVAHLTAAGAKVVIKFDERTSVDRVKFARLAMSQSDRYRLTPDGRLVIKLRDSEVGDLAQTAKNLLRRLG